MKRRSGFTLIELMIVVSIIVIIATVLLGSGASVGIYGYLNARQVTGNIESVTSAMPEGGAVISNGNNIFSVAVLLKTSDGSLVSFSSEDRQWATLRDPKYVGKCVTVKVFPYAPWDFSKSGTLHEGRMLQIMDKPCG